MNAPHIIQSPPSTHGDVLTAISDGMVALLKEFYGRGPTRAKSYYQDDLVVCVMRERFTGVIEDATGRQVIGFMSGNQQHPDLMCEVFILGPTDLVDEHEIPASEPSPSRG
jgi:uncharacterized protein YbcI